MASPPDEPYAPGEPPIASAGADPVVPDGLLARADSEGPQNRVTGSDSLPVSAPEEGPPAAGESGEKQQELEQRYFKP